jgi:hypothetical protein
MTLFICIKSHLVIQITYYLCLLICSNTCTLCILKLKLLTILLLKRNYNNSFGLVLEYKSICCLLFQWSHLWNYVICSVLIRKWLKKKHAPYKENSLTNCQERVDRSKLFELKKDIYKKLQLVSYSVVKYKLHFP